MPDPGHAYLFYASGVAFILLGVVALLLPRQHSRLAFVPHLRLLALFGGLTGLTEFIDWQYHLQHEPWQRWSVALLGVPAHVALLEFARRTMRSLKAGPLNSALLCYAVLLPGVVAFTLMAEDTATGLDAGSRLFIAVPGALLTAVAVSRTLILLPSASRRDRFSIWLVAGALAASGYGLLMLFTLHADPGLPGWLPREQQFPGADGLLVHLALALCALLATLALLVIMRLSNRRYLTDLGRVLDIIDGFVFRCRNDDNWSVLYLAGNVEGVTGHTEQEFFSLAEPGLAQLVHPADRPEVWAAVQEAVRAGRSYEVSYRLVTRDGAVRPVQERGEPVQDGQGAVLFLQGHIMDASALAESGRRLERAEKQAGLGHWEFSLADQGMYWSRQMFRLFGLDPSEGVPAPADYLRLIHPDDRLMIGRILAQLNGGHSPELSIYRTDPSRGPFRYLKPTCTRISNRQGGVLYFSGTLQDVTEVQVALETVTAAERRQAELLTLARMEQSRLSALLSAMDIGILFEDRQGLVEYVNPAFLRIWALEEPPALKGRPTGRVLERSPHQFSQPDHASHHTLGGDGCDNDDRVELHLRDGRILTQVCYRVWEDDGQPIGRLWIHEDVTRERQTAQQLVYLAEHDPLTGLFNRHRFQTHLETIINNARRHGAEFAVLYFDLDDFKYINDTFGHRAGDTVLVRTAGEIASLVRAGEMFARLGGDEFAIVTELTQGSVPDSLAERIIRTVSSLPFRFQGSNLRLTTSVGITLYPRHADNADDLVAHADAAMYQAKAAGKNTWALYDEQRDVSARMMNRMTWVTRIAEALEHQRFELHFQGVYHTASREPSHLEALVRMRDRSVPGGLIMPGQFIPIAEKSGHILAIDRWVLGSAIDTLAAHPQLPALAVNVSGRSLDDQSLAPFIEGLLNDHAVSPSRLIVELTETAAVTEMQDAQRFIEAAQRIGCIVYLDDFGTGFSTFAYLKYLAVQALKIDGMFIRDLPHDRENQAFVKAMVDVAHGLGKTVVAEFVEDEATLDMLAELGVDLAQGYHLDRPGPIHRLLNSGATDTAG